MTESPLNGGKDVLLHLDEGGLVIGVTVDLDEILDGGDAFLGILKLCGDPKGGATNKLVMFDVNDASRNVTVDDVGREVECFRSETESEVDLYEEINETRSHVPSNFWLLIHGLSRTHCVLLKTRQI
jgi:hypothetical protein